ncbi:MAG: AI-2E family transporter [Candidatus Aminicenantales bacterium]
MERHRIVIVAAGVIAIFIIGLVLRLAKPVLFPFFLALFIYFILSPVLDFLTRMKIPRAISLIFILLVSFLILYLLGYLFYSSGKSFAAGFPEYGDKISSLFKSLQGKLKIAGLKWDPLAWAGNLDIDKVGSFLLGSLGTFFSFLANLFLVFIFLMFMLAGRGKLQVKISHSFNPAKASQLIVILQNIDHQVQKYLAIKTIISLFSGILTTVILIIFGVDFAIVFGFLTFLLNYIPNIGSFISKVIPILFAFFQFGKFWPVFWLLLILTAVDGIVSMVIEPRLMGQGLGLSPLVVLFALFFWGWLWGIPGMILAVPIMAVMKIALSNIPSLRFLEALMSK